MSQPSSSYDFIFLGAGCASLSLLTRMLESGRFHDKKILIADRSFDRGNDRTWCFWERGAGFFESVVHKQWPRIIVKSEGFDKTLEISPYTYKMIRGIDFYQHCFQLLRRHSNVSFIEGEIVGLEAITQKTGRLRIGGVEVRTDNAVVFNSLFRMPEAKPGTLRLLQHFRGWTIETEKDEFDPELATLMDFRMSQQHGTTFCYVLPVSKRRALIEYTLFTEKLLRSEEYDQGLKDYIESWLKIHNYRIVETEDGVIPMIDTRFSFYKNGVYNIGTAGGQTKASSGYTFRFIQKQSDQILKMLLGKGLRKLTPVSSKYRFYDNTLLDILYHRTYSGRDIFAQLFKKNDPRRVLRFLDNESSLTDEIRIITSLPVWPFLKSAIRRF